MPSIIRIDPLIIQHPVHHVFSNAYHRISDVYHWSQGARARDAFGNNVRPNSPKAVMWSLNGAVAAESNSIGITPPSLLRFLDEILREKRMVRCLYAGMYDIWESCDDFNDQQTHSQVLGLLSYAAWEASEMQDGKA